MKNIESFFTKIVEIVQSGLDIILPQTKSEKILRDMTGEDFYDRAIKNLRKIDKTYAIFSYQDELVKSAIWSLKYRRNKKIAKLLSEAISPSFMEIIENEKMFNNFSNPILVPVPANKAKKRERGFDQTRLLVKYLIKQLPKNFIQTEIKGLKRVKKNLNQARTKSRQSRFENLKNSLIAKSNLKNKNIVVLDDVSTSGATFKEAKRALKKVGAKKIIFFVVAR